MLGTRSYLPCSFTRVYAVIFPAVTGIMEGANLSGDLKDPAKSIPEGTLWAILASFVTYMVLIFTMAFAFSPDTLRFDGNYWQESTVLAGVPIVVGVVISSLSSGLGALFGGSRIMQVRVRGGLRRVARDNPTTVFDRERLRAACVLGAPWHTVLLWLRAMPAPRHRRHRRRRQHSLRSQIGFVCLAPCLPPSELAPAGGCTRARARTAPQAVARDDLFPKALECINVFGYGSPRVRLSVRARPLALTHGMGGWVGGSYAAS